MKSFSDNVTILFFPSKTGIPGLLSILFVERRLIRMIFKRYNCDLIHFQDSGPHLFSVYGMHKERTIVTIHGIAAEEAKYKIGVRNKLKFRFKAIIDRLLLNKFSNYVFIAAYTRSFIKKSRIRYAIIPNAVNPLMFNENFSEVVSCRNLTYTGVIDKRKNLLFLLEVIHELVSEGIEFNLTVIGGSKDLSYLSAVERYITEHDLSDQVTLAGWQTQTIISEALKTASVLILPSLQECMPISIMEAMASGKVVIASNVGGIPEMLEDGISGFLFERNNKTQLKEVLRDIYYHPEIIEEIAVNANKTAREKFHPDTVARDTIVFYKSLMNAN